MTIVFAFDTLPKAWYFISKSIAGASQVKEHQKILRKFRRYIPTLIVARVKSRAEKSFLTPNFFQVLIGLH